MNMLPAEFNETTRTPIAHGVEVFGGSTKGLAYEFGIESEYNKKLSEELKYEVNPDFEYILIKIDKNNAAKHKIDDNFWNSRRPEERGKILAAYRRWKAGQTHGGTPFDKWQLITPGEALTLNSEKIYTVDQLAEVHDERLLKLPGRYLELKGLAQAHVKAKQLQETDVHAAAELEATKARLAELEAKMEAMMAPQVPVVEEEKAEVMAEEPEAEAPVKKKPGRPFAKK